MADTLFVDQQTLIPAAWLNDVNAVTYKVPTIAALRALTFTPGVIATKGYYAAGDGGSGFYWYDTSDVVTADNGGSVIVSANGARWKLLGIEYSIRQFGASPSLGDNSTYIQAAIDAAAADGFPLYINPGAFTYTTQLTIPGGLNLVYGAGNMSILQASGCHGMEFTVQAAYAGSRVFRDFFLTSTAGGAYSGIYANMTVASGHKVNGACFKNVTIQNFGYAINVKGFWTCSFEDLFVYGCYNGVLLSHRNVKITFTRCHLIAGTSPGGAGDRHGVQFLLDGGFRTEDAQLQGCYVYGWDIGVLVSNALYVVIDACDIDIIQETAVQIVTANGGCVVRDCWINTTNANATFGVVLSALGADIYDGVLIEGNHISCTTSHASSIGVDVGNNQSGTRVLNNRISGFPLGINGDAESLVTRDNRINASTTAIAIDSSASINNSIGPDTIQAGTPLAFSSGSAQPAGLQYWATGTFTITLTGMAAGTTGTVNWRSEGGLVSLALTANITGTSNTTAMTGTGAPQSIWPDVAQVFLPAVIDNGVYQMGRASMNAANGVITFGSDMSGAVFTAAGTKGLPAQTLTYQRA